MEVKLPFEIIRACRCSFVVDVNGRNCFISNQNLLAFMQNPNVEWRTTERRDARGIEMCWIEVREANWTLGLKIPLLFRNGQIVR
jgi:hypothetical protein